MEQFVNRIFETDFESPTVDPFDGDGFTSVDLFSNNGAADRKEALNWIDTWTDAKLREPRFPSTTCTSPEVGGLFERMPVAS